MLFCVDMNQGDRAMADRMNRCTTGKQDETPMTGVEGDVVDADQDLDDLRRMYLEGLELRYRDSPHEYWPPNTVVQGFEEWEITDALEYWRDLGFIEIFAQSGDQGMWGARITSRGRTYLRSRQGDSTPSHTHPEPVIIIASGQQSRVTIGSHDASVNIAKTVTPVVFDDLKKAISEGIADATTKAEALSHVKAMEDDHGTPSIMGRYTAFINFLAAHATIFAVVAPYMPALVEVIK